MVLLLMLIVSTSIHAQNSKQDSTLTEQYLNEVVVTATRTKQKRKAIAAAISSISANEIEKVKATGLEQLVNNVPGVYMATSKASGNEQHFMATRTPISTKPLFLFVEDGLPIRPTAVFNHNALLEINTIAIKKIEVVRGPASSIYGSEAIGGSFNFITKAPTPNLTGNLQFEGNELGLFGLGVELANQQTKNFGFYSGTSYRQRNNGPIGHSNYHKLATTFKTVFDITKNSQWTNVVDLVDYKSDMSGSLSERNYLAGRYESNQTFTNRVAKAFRLRSTLDQNWSKNQNTSFLLSFRANEMNQIPSYRIRQFRQNGQLTGFGSGESNSNSFKSFVGLVQHNLNFNKLKVSVGASADFSHQEYFANPIRVTVNTITGANEDYQLDNSIFLLHYEADIFNTGVYTQVNYNPIPKLQLSAGVRYDYFSYDYNNQNDGVSGAKDSKSTYTNVAPKFGINYNISSKIGLYTNLANGFSPPQVSSLYRNRYVGTGGEIFDLKPSNFYNYELGSYLQLSTKIKADIALYLLEGKNRLVTTRNNDGDFVSTNAGKTRSYGVEYGIIYKPLNGVTLSHNGSYSLHKYITFFDGGVDYSDTEMSLAPNIIGTTRLTYEPSFINNLSVTAEYELMGQYNTSFENQVNAVDQQGNTITTTNTYGGHHIFNLRASYTFNKVEIWAQALNLANRLYAVHASYNKYARQNTYSIGNPRAIHFGIKFSL